MLIYLSALLSESEIVTRHTTVRSTSMLGPCPGPHTQLTGQYWVVGAVNALIPQTGISNDRAATQEIKNWKLPIMIAYSTDSIWSTQD